jgi:hypothetical protein
VPERCGRAPATAALDTARSPSFRTGTAQGRIYDAWIIRGGVKNAGSAILFNSTRPAPSRSSPRITNYTGYSSQFGYSQFGYSMRLGGAFLMFGHAKRGSCFIYGVGAHITRPGSPTSVFGGMNSYASEQGQLAINLRAGFPC